MNIGRRNFGLSLLGIGLIAPVASAWGKVFSSTESIPVSPLQKKTTNTLQQTTSTLKQTTSSYRITYLPYRRAGFEEMPVFVFNVVGQTMKEPLTRRFSVKNHSDKAIKEIQISLRVMVDRYAVMPVLHQVSSSYVFTTPLLPQAEDLIKGEDNLKELFGTLFVDGHLNGGYRVEVLVSKVWFEDGSKWEA